MNQPTSGTKLLRLEQLVSEKSNGSLNADGYAELQVLLAESAELRYSYWQMIAMHADLEWDLAGKLITRHEAECQLPEILLADSPSAGTNTLTQNSGRHWWGLAMAAGIVIVLFGGWQIYGLNQQPQVAETVHKSISPEPAAGQLTSLLQNSRWSFGRPGDHNPEDFNYGDTVWVEEGLVQIQLEGGTVGQLQAPAILQLLTQDRVRLLSGKIKVNAPARTNGFTVETPSAEVVDLGTEFSVEAAESGTDLVVYGGKVDLKVPRNGDRENTSKQFTAGQAVHVNRNGTLSRIMNITSSATENTAKPHVITSVADNIVRDDMWQFYEIVWQGMQEDTYAFVDRVHEWNGQDKAGMPAYLVGGDYIKTFNDDKSTDNLKIDVTVSQPSVIYILFDKRCSPPTWLTDSFEVTEDEIGVDESGDTGHFFHDDERWAQIGPGRSINRVHSIWKKVVPEAGTVQLGPNGKNDPNQKPFQANMYGIVAVPLKQTAL